MRKIPLSQPFYPQGASRPPMEKGETKKAFTLVELIVVITILAILGTIAFLSLQGYSTNARNSTRTSDLSSLKSALELYSLKVGGYPDPTAGVAVTYSGATAWTQGTMGDTVIKQLSNINKKPVDPLVGNEYTYSLLNTRGEYQLGSIEETGYGYNSVMPAKAGIYEKSIIPNSYAANSSAKAIIIGNYNGQILKLSTGSIDYILAVPSIVTTDITIKDIGAIILNKTLAYNSYTNLPGSYNGKGYTMTGGFTYQPTNIVVFTGSTSTLSSNLANSGTLQIALIDNLKSAYQGTVLTTDPNISQILNTTNSTDKQNLVSGMFRNRVGGLLGTVTVSSTTTTSGYTGACPSGQGWNGSACVVATNCTTGLTEITLSNGQVWSCMNLGATTVRDGSTNTFTTCTSNLDCSNKPNWYGDYYQWGRNEPVNTTTIIATYNGAFSGLLGHNNFVLGEGTYGDWWQNEAGSSSPTRWTGVNPQGPCPSGRHVPSQNDWQLACNNILSTTCSNGMAYNSLIATTLRLPFAGYRNWTNAFYYNQSTNASYWSSTPYSVNSYYLYFNASLIYPANNNNRGYGFSLRCLKN